MLVHSYYDCSGSVPLGASHLGGVQRARRSRQRVHGAPRWNSVNRRRNTWVRWVSLFFNPERLIIHPERSIAHPGRLIVYPGRIMYCFYPFYNSIVEPRRIGNKQCYNRDGLCNICHYIHRTWRPGKYRRLTVKAPCIVSGWGSFKYTYLKTAEIFSDLQTALILPCFINFAVLFSIG